MAVTWDSVNKGGNVTLSNGNLTTSIPKNTQSVIATEGKTTGKWYWEITVNSVNTGGVAIGVIKEGVNLNTSIVASDYTMVNSRLYSSNGTMYAGANGSNAAYSAGDTIGVALDLDNKTLSYYKNGELQPNIFTNIDRLGEKVFAGVSSANNNYGGISTANFGASEFKYAIPKGYTSYDGSQKLITNKTLILHDGEYKKWNEGSPPTEYMVDDQNSIPPMKSNTSPSGKAFTNVGYTTIGSPYSAFDGDTKTTFAINKDVTGSITFYIGYEFDLHEIVKKYSVVQGYTSAKTEFASNWTFEGSNDGILWEVLDTQVNQYSNFNKDFKEIIYEIDNNKRYKMYRLNVTNNGGSAKYNSINELKMFKVLSEDSDGSYGSWELISTKTPSLEQFLSEGIDSLSPLLDRRIETLDPQQMQNKSEILSGGEEGKVFSKTIDLKKYIDIRNIKVRVNQYD